MAKGIHLALVQADSITPPYLGDALARENHQVFIVAPTYLRSLWQDVREAKQKAFSLQEELSNLRGKMNLRDGQNKDLERQVSALTGFIQCLKGAKSCPGCGGGGCPGCSWSGWIGVEVEGEKS